MAYVELQDLVIDNYTAKELHIIQVNAVFQQLRTFANALNENMKAIHTEIQVPAFEQGPDEPTDSKVTLWLKTF